MLREMSLLQLKSLPAFYEIWFVVVASHMMPAFIPDQQGMSFGFNGVAAAHTVASLFAPE